MDAKIIREINFTTEAMRLLTKALECAREGNMLHAVEYTGRVEELCFDRESDGETVPQYIRDLLAEIRAANYTYDRLAYITYEDNEGGEQ